ncbi:salivary glue protein Sgs-3-like [Hydractinia symbiolongicarpus]|uniref:salivary glue protein Sgs-3-like n=1 Tax=Hydractinia symbiolongicarpus TaxID=13093 RepID=UPI0025511898|nr:salivary glue protein Sgs-3-like [Hydractinia symbiolongicarpus]
MCACCSFDYSYQFAKSTSEPTIVLKTNPNQPLGGRKLTPSDILQLNLYYECEGIAKSTPTTTTRPTTSTTTTTRPTTTTTTTKRLTTTATTTARPTTTTTTTTRPTTTTTTTTLPTTTTTTTTRPKTTTTTTTRSTNTTTTTKRPKTTTTASCPITTTTTTRQKTATRAATKKITGTIFTAQPSTFGNKKTPIARSTLKPVIRSTKVCGDETYLCSRALVNRMICTFPKFCRRSCGLCSGPSENMCDLLVDAINVGCESSTRKEHCVSKDKRERRRMKQECPKTCCMLLSKYFKRKININFGSKKMNIVYPKIRTKYRGSPKNECEFNPRHYVLCKMVAQDVIAFSVMTHCRKILAVFNIKNLVIAKTI